METRPSRAKGYWAAAQGQQLSLRGFLRNSTSLLSVTWYPMLRGTKASSSTKTFEGLREFAASAWNYS